MNVVMIGCGYVGLVSGACFAEFGTSVVCVDKDSERVDRLNAGELPIYEPGLDDLLARNVRQGRLAFSTDLADAVAAADLVFIAVGTPARRGEGHADLSYVYAAAREIAAALVGDTVVVTKSTVPVGTSRNVARIMREEKPQAPFAIASNPEFLRQGAAISDFMRPDRVVIGVESAAAEERLRELYRPLNLIESPVMVTDLESAELIKYASNAFLATKISFINEISGLCEATGADVHAVAKGMGLDKRIGSKFLHPGPGFGGSCFPKDARALIRIAQEAGAASRLVEAAVEINSHQKGRMVKKIRDALGGDESGKTVAVLGLTFKPETDDMREAPALTILPSLADNGAVLRVHDPQGMESAKPLLPQSVIYCDDPMEAALGADAVVLLTEWNQYRGLDLAKLKSVMAGDAFLDLRNVYERTDVLAAGLRYDCVGR